MSQGTSIALILAGVVLLLAPLVADVAYDRHGADRAVAGAPSGYPHRVGDVEWAVYMISGALCIVLVVAPGLRSRARALIRGREERAGAG